MILSFFNSLGTDGSFGNEDGENSVLAEISRTITPVFTPMGIEKENWPATVGLITGIFAKEAIVGTINSLYGQIAAGESGNTGTADMENNEAFSLSESLEDAFKSIPRALSGIFGGNAAVGQTNPKDNTFTAMQNSFGNDWVRAYAYLLFVLIYIPCVAAMGAMIREIGPKFGALAVVYLTVLAWSVATLFYQIARGHSILLMGLSIGLVLMFIPVFNLLSGRKSFAVMR